MSDREKRQREIAREFLSQYLPVDMKREALIKIKKEKIYAGEDVAIVCEELGRQGDKQLELLNRIKLLTDELPEVQRDIIELTYVYGRSLQYIAIELNYSIQHIKRLKAQALTTIGNIIEHETQ